METPNENATPDDFGKQENEHNQEMRDLPVTLSKGELWARSEELVKEQKAITELKETKRETVAEINEDIKLKEKRIDKLVTALDTGVERRHVMCEWRHNVKSREMELYRLDTGEQVVSRKMTDDERQGFLPI